MDLGTDDVIFTVVELVPGGGGSYTEIIADGLELYRYGFGLECGYEPSLNPGADFDMEVSITNGSGGPVFVKWIDGDGCLSAEHQFEIAHGGVWGAYPTRQDHRWIVAAPGISDAEDFEGTFPEWDDAGILAASGVIVVQGLFG